MNALAILTTVFGVAMSFGYFIQTYKIFKTKTVKGVSLATYIFFSIGILMWLIYGIIIRNIPIIITNIVFIIGALSVIFAYLTYKKR